MNSAESVNMAFQKHNMKECADRQERLEQKRKFIIDLAVGFILTTFVIGMLCVGAVSQLPGLEGFMWPSLGAMAGLWIVMVLIVTVRTKVISNRMIKNQYKSNLAALHYDIHGVPENYPFDGMDNIKEVSQ